jgi:hypothetical protein
MRVVKHVQPGVGLRYASPVPASVFDPQSLHCNCLHFFLCLPLGICIWSGIVQNVPLDITVDVCMYLLTNGHAHRKIDIGGHWWTLVDIDGHWWILVDISVFAWTCMDMCGHAWTFVDMNGQVWACVDMRGHVLTVVDNITYGLIGRVIKNKGITESDCFSCITSCLLLHSFNP